MRLNIKTDYDDRLKPQQLESRTSQVAMYVSFAIVVFLVFGMLGTRNNWTKIKQTNAKAKELTELKHKVDQKKAYLEQTEKELQSLKPQERAISNMIPQGQNFEKYVEEIVAENSDYGFDVEKVAFSTNTKTGDKEATVALTFSTEEDEYDLENLIKSLEKTPRISIIDTLDYSNIAGTKKLRVNLKIYMID